MKKTPDFDAAAAFLAGHARVLDRRMFQRLFCDGAAGPVRDAVAAYRNSDGGFGHALEPDCRAAASQPAAVEMALRMMDLADEWDARLVRDAVDWLAAVAPAAPSENSRWNIRRSSSRACPAMKAAAASKSGVFFMKPIPPPSRAGVLNETAIDARFGSRGILVI